MKCNNLKCRKKISKVCLTTTCLHVFCRSCLMTVKKTKICMACKSLCNDSDVSIKELDKLPNLLGYLPHDVLETCRNSIAFYQYQTEQESIIHDAIIEEVESGYEKLKHEIKIIKANYELEIESLKNNIDRVERSLDRERQNNYDLGLQLEEKSKQYQKLIQASTKQKYFNTKLNDLTNNQQHIKQ